MPKQPIMPQNSMMSGNSMIASNAIFADVSSFYKGAGPVFMGIKPAAYLTVRRDEFCPVFVREPLKYFSIPCAKGIRYFIYDQELMARQLKMPDRAYMLGLFGYFASDLMTEALPGADFTAAWGGTDWHRTDWYRQCLFRLYGRLCRYEQCECGKNKNFPHELGIFLGYPTEDVIGFLVNRGRAGKEGRFFKMYADSAGSARLQTLWEKAGAVLWNAIQAGMTPDEAVCYYRNI